MKTDIFQKLVVMVGHPSAFPTNVREILALTEDVNCSPKELARSIESNQLLSIKLLHFLNSNYCSLPTPITSIDHAVIYLGIDTIKHLALSLASSGILPINNSAGVDCKKYLVHSLCTAGIAKQLALRVGFIDPMNCLMAGLLHDFGKLVIARFLPKEFRLSVETSVWKECSLYQTLIDIVGTDHAAVGAMTLEKWGLPAELVEAIRNQHHPDPSSSPMTVCVFAANQICKKLEFGYAGNLSVEELTPTFIDLLGGPLTEVIVSLGDLKQLLAEAQSFAEI